VKPGRRHLNEVSHSFAMGRVTTQVPSKVRLNHEFRDYFNFLKYGGKLFHACCVSKLWITFAAKNANRQVENQRIPKQKPGQ
jgi:hypothetical protein